MLCLSQGFRMTSWNLEYIFVAGIVGRADVLACLLFLLAFLSYNRSLGQCCAGERFPSTDSPVFLLLSLLLGTFAMLVKETGITVFGVCLVYDLFSPSYKEGKVSNGVLPEHSPQQPGSPRTSSLPPHSHRDLGRQRFPHKVGWGGCHSPLPPEPKSGFLLSPRTLWTLMRGWSIRRYWWACSSWHSRSFQPATSSSGWGLWWLRESCTCPAWATASCLCMD
ncbi:protein O-mannosyl-transferase TMTC1-like [Thomomys bottae]